MPQIENIKITAPYGEVSHKENEYVYPIVSAGFYTISFNSIVDKEQAPISQMIIKIRKITESWDNSAPIIMTGLDHKPNSSNPHRLVRFLTPGDYMVAIKVVDNWDFFRCSGISGFNALAEGGVPRCQACCKGNSSLYDNFDCFQCAYNQFNPQADNLPGLSTANPLFTCPESGPDIALDTGTGTGDGNGNGNGDTPYDYSTCFACYIDATSNETCCRCPDLGWQCYGCSSSPAGFNCLDGDNYTTDPDGLLDAI